MAKTIKRTVLIDVDSKVDNANQKMGMFKGTILDTKGAVGSLKTSFAGMAAGAVGIGAAIGVVTSAFGKLASEISRINELAIEWEGTVGSLGNVTQNLSQQTAGLISEKSLSMLAEYGQKFGWTREQMEAVSKATVEYARVNKVDFNSALTTVTNTIVTARESGLVKLGVTVEDLSKNKMVRMGEVLDAVTDKFKDYAVSADNAAEATDAARNAAESAEARFGVMARAALNLNDRLKEQANYYNQMSDLAETWGGDMENASDRAITTFQRMLAVQHQLTGPAEKLQELWAKSVAIQNKRAAAIAKSSEAMRAQNAAVRVAIGLMEDVTAGVNFAVKGVEVSVNAANKAYEALTASRKRFGGGSKQAFKDEFNTMVKAREEYNARQLAIYNDGRKVDLQAEFDAHKQIENLKKQNRRLDAKAEKKWMEAQQKLRDKESAAAMDAWQANVERGSGIFEEFTMNVAGNVSAVIQGQKSLGAAIKDMTLGFLSAKAIEWGAMAVAALGRYALSWGTDAGALAAAKFYGIAAGIAGHASLAIGIGAGGFGGGGGGGDAESFGGGGASTGFGAGTSRSASTAGGGSGEAPASITNVNFYGRGGLLMTRKDMKAASKRLQAGRIP